MGDFWVFGYGSLMWRPGFQHSEARRARLQGYRRALCLRSVVHRGTPERPGLVLGLDRGGACVGVAFRVEEADREAVTAYLRERELVTTAYRERILPVLFAGGAVAQAMTYVVDRHHPLYAGRLDAAHAAAIVRRAEGKSGFNADYVLSTVSHLRSLGIRDPWLEEVAQRVTDGPASSAPPAA
ncbi:MAG: gamma-glutamylcyclotransferase [Methylobacterium mesophilicum]|nr:gamma-glutamylcyclotransferase [Methylobacterium mesophilicum]